MREILFRGKQEEYPGEWIEGMFTIGKFAGEEYHAIERRERRIITYDYEWTMQPYKVIPDTIGQYTGLTDKNGKKIFEGDYIVCRQAIQGNFIVKHIEMGYVEMKHGAFGLHRKQGYYRPFKDWLEDYEYEVLGNIHDNPELLR